VTDIRTLPGKVTRIADALQPGTRTLLTEVDISNPDGALTAGMYCRIELHIPRKTSGFLVPADAIIFNRDGLHVAVIEDGVAHFRRYRWRATSERKLRCATAPVNLVEGSWVEPRSRAAGST
jgi:multidrug efflux pump subunit AcrA (membrane-fusion protein)